jgi:hypothetical protein
LEALAFHRLHEERRPQPLRWLRPIVFAALLIFLAVSALFFARFTPTEETSVNVSSSLPVEVSPVATAPAPRAKSPVAHHVPAKTVRPSGVERMTLQLPYSNSAIENGTQATIRVAMSQSDLLSLGFPVNATLQDRRIAADVTLGDDGLPRAISLPLPLEMIQEKK